MLVILVMAVIYVQKNLLYPLNISPTATFSFSEFDLQVIFHGIDR